MLVARAMLTIVSAIFGGYDHPKQHAQQSVLCEFVTVTEDDRYADLHPRRAAKRPKLFPWEYADTDLTVWIDGAFQITSPDFAADIVDILATTDLALFRHPWRDCIYDEVHASREMRKYAGEPLEEQAAAYGRAGHPRNWGLWACGVIARRDTPVNRDLSYAWWDEMAVWSYQDQLSLPVVLRRHGVIPDELPGQVFANPWLTWHNHTRSD